MRELLQKAMLAQNAGNLAEAARLYGDVLNADPRNFDALLSLSLLNFRTARFDEAERLAGEAARVNRRSAEAVFIRGCALQRLTRNADALACFETAIAIRPAFAEAPVNRGALLIAEKRFADALKCLDQALTINPAMLEAWNNRGNVLSELGRYQDAVLSYDKVIAARPDAVEALINRGTALIALHRFDDARVSYERASRLDPSRADAIAGRANALFEAKDYEHAVEAYAEVLQRDPAYDFARGNLAFSRLYCCDWTSLAAERVVIARDLQAEKRVASPFQAIALLDSPADLKRCATIWSMTKYPSAPAALWRGEPYDHAKIRVAYLSADFNGHAVATLMAGVWERHDKSRFETTAVSYVDSNGSAMRQRVERAFDRVIDVAGKSDAEAAAVIRRMQIDIVIDLMGFTGDCRPGILAQRPAPVQVNFLGFPGTMGAPHIDYVIADPIVVPDEDRQHYCESVVHLPDSYLPGDSARRIAEQKPSRAEAGLPEHGFVFCSFNNSYKLSPEVFDVWMRLLNAIEGSALWLPQMKAASVRNLRREAGKHGVSEQRLVFAPFVADDEDHLARVGIADLFLDTLPYNAHSTAVDALWAGVPVLTMRGNAFAGRVASSVLNAAHLPELIADSLADYENLALRLARESHTLAAIKAKLARNRETSVLFDTARYTRGLEAAYTHMWQRHRNGEPPAHFAVPSTP